MRSSHLSLANYPSAIALRKLREAALDPTYVSLGTRRTATTHEFYRYPARFPPAFAKSAVEAFSSPGDVVLDPYVGGGTTVVAAQMLGRPSIGTDVNPLATFVTRVKTTPLAREEIEELRIWGDVDIADAKLVGRVRLAQDWVSAGYLRNLDSREVWRTRSLMALLLAKLQRLTSERSQDLARCAILRTGQWALDMTAQVPRVADFREALRSNLSGMLEVVENGHLANEAVPVSVGTVGLPGLKESGVLVDVNRPRLILTSPPYPGVYVLYHRWKVLGRKESPAPYWIAAELDGHGMAHYTMGDRNEDGLETYFDTIRSGFTELVQLADPDAWVVQMVGFKDVEEQLPRYLDVLGEAGLSEVRLPTLATNDDGRLWREVPNRRWWTQNDRGQQQARQTSREVVLVHRQSR